MPRGIPNRGIPANLARGTSNRAFRGIPDRGIPAFLEGYTGRGIPARGIPDRGIPAR